MKTNLKLQTFEKRFNTIPYPPDPEVIIDQEDKLSYSGEKRLRDWIDEFYLLASLFYFSKFRSLLGPLNKNVINREMSLEVNMLVVNVPPLETEI